MLKQHASNLARHWALIGAGLLVLAALMAISAVPGYVKAQNPTPLSIPGVDSRTNGAVYAIAIQPNGGLIIGGMFSTFDGQPRMGLARLHPDGTLDQEWNPMVSRGWVNSLAVDARGDVYVAGNLGHIGGQYRLSIAKLAGNGTGDAYPEWNPKPDTGPMQAVAVDPVSGAVYVAGFFTQIGGVSRKRIAKLSADTGEVDRNWPAAASDIAQRTAATGTTSTGGGADDSHFLLHLR